ncbi:MAG TPA: hypothetical protein VFM41_10925 [Gaiella sp.]|jgi:hypothetical protein|nr:hypothetical protein [Gaiella sp.]
MISVDLYWLPLGVGGRSVRLNGLAFEAIAAGLARRDRFDLYHSALEVRRRHEGLSDIAEAVESPRRLSEDLERARRVLDRAAGADAGLGRDQLGVGEMWNSNSTSRGCSPAPGSTSTRSTPSPAAVRPAGGPALSSLGARVSTSVVRRPLGPAARRHRKAPHPRGFSVAGLQAG